MLKAGLRGRNVTEIAGGLPAAPPLIAQQRSQRLAWGVLLLSFAVFCVLCLFATLGVHYFFFQSRVAMPSLLVVSRGTAGLTESDLIEQVVRRGREIYNRAIISTDALSQATISFIDHYEDSRLVASVTLRSRSSLDLERIERPRFNWSTERYVIELGGFSGDVMVSVGDRLGRDLLLSLETEQGTVIRLSPGGRYNLSANADQTQVISLRGTASITTPDRQSFAVLDGQRALLDHASEQMVFSAGYQDLIVTDGFSSDNVVDMTASAPPLSNAVWRCRSAQISSPEGAFGLERIDGRSAMRMWRGGGANSHGETFCIQNLGLTAQEGLDVSMFDSLIWRVTFKVVSQSLGTCGSQGSECPFTLRMDYIPTSGERAISWYHGFYVTPSAQFEYPLRCDSCTQDHQNINENAWYTYDSGNLFTLIPEGQRPKSILNVRFYASGHEYDVYVEDVSLLAGRSGTITFTAGSPTDAG
jgi:hypothetical protein